MTTRRTGFFISALESMMVSGERQAARQVNNALLLLDDATLKSRGLSRTELQANRTGYLL